MSEHVKDILERMESISGTNLIAWSINYFLENDELTNDALISMASQIKDQIHDNPTMMKELLSPENYAFFDLLVL